MSQERIERGQARAGRTPPHTPSKDEVKHIELVISLQGVQALLDVLCYK